MLRAGSAPRRPWQAPLFPAHRPPFHRQPCLHNGPRLSHDTDRPLPPSALPPRRAPLVARHRSSFHRQPCPHDGPRLSHDIDRPSTVSPAPTTGPACRTTQTVHPPPVNPAHSSVGHPPARRPSRAETRGPPWPSGRVPGAAQRDAGGAEPMARAQAACLALETFLLKHVLRATRTVCPRAAEHGHGGEPADSADSEGPAEPPRGRAHQPFRAPRPPPRSHAPASLTARSRWPSRQRRGCTARRPPGRRSAATPRATSCRTSAPAHRRSTTDSAGDR